MADQNPFAALKAHDWLAPTHYTITSIGSLPATSTSASYSNANAVNNSRSVVGQSVSQAVMYRNGVLIPVGPPPRVGCNVETGCVISTSANAINNSGYIVRQEIVSNGAGGGNGCASAASAVAFTGPSISSFAGGCSTGSSATGVNNLGYVVGDLRTILPIVSGAFYSYQGVTALLDPGYNPIAESNGLAGSANGVNDNKIAVGATFGGIAQIYTPNGNWTIGTLGGPASSATAIADSGLIVGWSNISKSSSVQHAFVYYDKAMYDFGTPIGTNPITTSSAATSINNFNEFVGSYTLANGTQRAFVYAEYMMHDLKSLVRNSAGWTLLTATGTNDCGDIVGTGTYKGNMVGYLARAINVNNQRKRRYYGCTF